ncbi:CFA/I fimbrial subunit C usher protein [Klebsiella michiganensis]|uniref:CFA/I fimbrial subunit C usher protein n=1 Tax=Klebsiella michiganensis TaxID=1134687 RepID=A0A7H4LZ33_9ENTR|nr:CFA/I fimbrial subunit C usher protein [Klebsiella michiganensis]
MAQFDTRYSTGTLNVNSGVDGYVNTNLTANGSVGWQGEKYRRQRPHRRQRRGDFQNRP